MSERDDDRLPEKLRADLHGLIPSGPEDWHGRSAEFLGNAHRQVGRASRWVRAARRVAVAATILIAAGIAWQVQRTPTDDAQLVAGPQPTIVDALRLAKRPSASQAQIDRIAMAAVQVKLEAVQ